MVQAQLGYAADGQGNGVAYARLTSRAGARLVRVAFRVERYAGLDGREVGYGALTAVAGMLAERGVDGVAFYIPSDDLVADRRQHRQVPPPIVLPYVRLGCVLNRFKHHDVRSGEDPDLTQRALAEVTLRTAA